MSKELIEEIESLFKGAKEMLLFRSEGNDKILLDGIKTAIKQATPKYKVDIVINQLEEIKENIEYQIKKIKNLNTRL